MILQDRVYVRKTKATLYYGTSLWIAVSRTIEAAIEAVESHLKFEILDCTKPCPAAYTFVYSDSEVGQRVIIFLAEDAEIGHISHECLHALNSIFAYHGQRRSRKNDEHECYYIDYLATEVKKSIDRYRLLKRAKKFSKKRVKIPR